LAKKQDEPIEVDQVGGNGFLEEDNDDNDKMDEN
jgi:hypothetical protein